MGQYYKTVNLDRTEVLNPHKFGEGLKLMEFGCSSNGTMTALATLIHLSDTHKGPWAGNRIVVTGDYADEGEFVPEGFKALNLYTYVGLLGEPYSESSSDDAEFKQAAKKLSELPPAKFLEREDVNAVLEEAGYSLRLRESGRFSLDANPVVPSALALNRQEPYRTMEELVEAFGLYITESLETAIEDIMRELRVSRVSSDFAWASVKEATLNLDANEEQLSVTVKAIYRDEPVVQTRELSFPASVRDVRYWLGVSQDT